MPAWRPVRLGGGRGTAAALAPGYGGLRGEQLGSWLGTRKHPNALMAAVAAASVLAVGVGTGISSPLVGIAMIAGLALSALVVERPDIGAYILVATVPAVAGFQRGFPVPGFRISEILQVGFGTLILLSARRQRLQKWNGFDLLALTYSGLTILLGGFDLLDRGVSPSPEGIGTLVGPLQYLLLYRATLVALPRVEERRQALRLVLLASIPVSVLGVLQEAHIGAARSLITKLTGVDITVTFGAEGGGHRATSVFPHWQVFAAYEFWILLLGIALLVEGRQRVIGRTPLAAVLLLAAAGLASTVTFGVVFMVLAGTLVLGVWAGHSTRVLIGIGIAAVLGATFVSAYLSTRYHEQFKTATGNVRPVWVPQTLYYRYEVWTVQYLPVIRERLLTGFGPELPSSIQYQYSESFYVTLMMRGGLALLAVFLALCASLLVRLRTVLRDADPERVAVARVLFIAVVAMLPMHMLEDYFTMTGFAQLFWIVSALALASPPAVARARRFGGPGGRARAGAGATRRPRPAGSIS